MIYGTSVLLGLGVLYGLRLYLGTIRSFLVLVGILHDVRTLVEVRILVGLGVLK